MNTMFFSKKKPTITDKDVEALKAYTDAQPFILGRKFGFKILRISTPDLMKTVVAYCYDPKTDRPDKGWREIDTTYADTLEDTLRIFREKFEEMNARFPYIKVKIEESELLEIKEPSELPSSHNINIK